MIGTFGGGDGDDIVDELDDEHVVVEVAGLFRGGAGGGVMGSTFTLQSLELRFGEMRAGKLSVFVHWDKLRTMVSFLGGTPVTSSLARWLQTDAAIISTVASTHCVFLFEQPETMLPLALLVH